MNRQKIIFLIVLGVAGLFIASIAASMFPAEHRLPNGYEVLMGDKGETWVRSPDRQVLVRDVTSVWTAGDRILIERHTLDDKPPFGFRDCDYQLAEGKSALKLISKIEAHALIAGMKLSDASSKTCTK